MSRRLKIKLAVLVAVALASMVVMGLLLYAMQSNLSLQSYDVEMQQEADELPQLLEDAQAEAEQNASTYDAFYRSKADTVVYIATHNAGFEVSDAKMAELKALLNVDNVMVVSRDGQILAKAQDTKADFASSRFNRLQSVFDGEENPEAVEVEVPEQDWFMRYYSSRLDDSSMVVIEQNPTELHELVEAASSTTSVLQNITIGQQGYVMAISARDYLIEYHPDQNLVGADALDEGILAEQFEDGYRGWMNLDGGRIYGQVMLIDNTYYISAVPEVDMINARIITTGVILFIFFAVITIVILYGIFVLRDEEKRHGITGGDEKNYRTFGRFRYNKVIGRKAAVLSLVGFLAILGISFYMQTLFALSSQSIANNERAQEVYDTIDRANDRRTALTDQYAVRYLNKTRALAYVIEHNGALANRNDLQELADVLHVQYVFVYGNDAHLIATNSPYSNYSLSDNPDDLSYEFRRLLQGADSVVQDAAIDEVSGDLRQFIGVPLRDDNYEVTGIAEIGIRPTRLENLIASVQINSVLENVKVGTDGFAFAISKDDGTVVYYPYDRVQGKVATEVGMQENQIKDGYNDYITINGATYYASSIETEGYYVYVATSEGELMAERVPLSLVTGGMAALCLITIFLLLSFSPVPTRSAARRQNEGEDSPGVGSTEAGSKDATPRMIDITMPDGRTAKTEAASSRWIDKAFKWQEKTPEQKTATVLRWIVGFSVLVVFLAVIFQDHIFYRDSVFDYILNGDWERGLNIFAISACVMFICVAMTVVTLVHKLLELLSSVLGARGETVCRLIANFIKYATVIGMVYYCLLLVGVDGTALLASAGILSIAISFGAKELVSDILSGLFIIFEGEFRVGDIIKVGDWRGTVVEIGVRTTKVEDGSQNIKVIRNSDISNVINMTKETSYASCDVGIEYGESLERVENILSKELPLIRKRLPAILDGPFYRGVVSLGDNSVNIRIVVQCAEGDRVQLERDLNREMKLLFDKHDISIPFPQVVINQPTEFKKATAAEKRSADKFNEEQKAATKEMHNEDEDDARD